jgi:hypothetical protein
MTTPSWSGNRWRATHAAPRRDGKGSRRFQRWCCGVRLAALTFPPSPPSSPALRERKGEGASSPSPQPLPLSHDGSGRGREHPHLPRRPFPLPHGGSGRGRISGAGAILARSPLFRSAGEGPGVRVARTFPAAPSVPSRREWKGEDQRSRGEILSRSPLSRSAREGPGGRAARTFPAAPFRSLTAGVEGEGSAEQGRY